MAFSFYNQTDYANKEKAHNADMGNVHIDNDRGNNAIIHHKSNLTTKQQEKHKKIKIIAKSFANNKNILFFCARN